MKFTLFSFSLKGCLFFISFQNYFHKVKLPLKLREQISLTFRNLLQKHMLLFEMQVIGYFNCKILIDDTFILTKYELTHEINHPFWKTRITAIQAIDCDARSHEATDRALAGGYPHTPHLLGKCHIFYFVKASLRLAKLEKELLLKLGQSFPLCNA